VLEVEKNIGGKLTDGFAMLPAASVSGYYMANADSKFFGVAKIDSTQVKNYAIRKNISEKEAEKLLQANLG
jgi:5-methyltetrahydrofolate--homocysteine methyltransferase